MHLYSFYLRIVLSPILYRMKHGSKFQKYNNFYTVKQLYISSNYFIRWLPAYRDALSFRTSHYFITFLSQAVMTAAGFTDYRFIPKQNKDTLSYKFLGPLFVNPYNIEIPRSLVTVVTNWNFPMHYWLKTCKCLT